MLLMDKASATSLERRNKPMYFEKYPQAGQWRWRLKGANHEIVASGESYIYERDCDHAIDLVKSTNSNTPVYRR